MPVVQLQDDSGANLGAGLGAAAGYFAGKKSRDAAKATAQADKAHTTAREDQEAADRGQLIHQQIQSATTNNANTEADRAAKDVQQHLFQKYSALVSAGPPKDADPKRWASALQAQAAQDGFTDKDLRNEVIANAQAVVASRAPKITDVTHGLPQLKPGAAPKDITQHYMDAASRVLQSDLPEDQKKLLVEQYQKMAASAVKEAPKPLSPREQYFKDHGVDPPTYQDLHPRPERPSHFGEVTPAQQHQWDLEDKRFKIEEARFNADYPGGKKVPKHTPSQGDTDWKTINGSDPVKRLDPEVRAALQQGVSAYGLQGVITHLRSGSIPPGLNQTQAQKMLKAVGG